MTKRVVIVPVDGTILIEKEHMNHTDFASLGLHDKLAHKKPNIGIHQVTYDPETGYAIVQWEHPKQTILTRDEFYALCGHCVDAHKAHFDKLEAERLEWEKRDQEQTAKIEAASVKPRND